VTNDENSVQILSVQFVEPHNALVRCEHCRRFVDLSETAVCPRCGRLMEVTSKPAQFQRCACGKLIVRRGDAHDCPYCGRRLEWDAAD